MTPGAGAGAGAAGAATGVEAFGRAPAVLSAPLPAAAPPTTADDIAIVELDDAADDEDCDAIAASSPVGAGEGASSASSTAPVAFDPFLRPLAAEAAADATSSTSAVIPSAAANACTTSALAAKAFGPGAPPLPLSILTAICGTRSDWDTGTP
jgi:hypothetical protein